MVKSTIETSRAGSDKSVFRKLVFTKSILAASICCAIYAHCIHTPLQYTLDAFVSFSCALIGKRIRYTN